MAIFRQIAEFPVEVADAGDSPNTRVLLFRHTRLSDDDARRLEQVPGSRCILIGGHATAGALRTALRQIPRSDLDAFLGAPLSGGMHHKLVAHLGLSRAAKSGAATNTVEFRQLGNHPLQAANVGDTRQTRVLLLRHVALSDDERRRAEHVPGTRVLLLGGQRTRQALVALMKDVSRRQLSDLLQWPVSGSTFKSLREYLDRD